MQFQEEMEALLERHVLNGLVDAPWAGRMIQRATTTTDLESLNTGWTFCPTFWNHMRNALANLSRDPNMDV